MYRGISPAVHFLCLFLANLCQKFYFHRLFCVLSGQQFKGFSYYESLILYTWVTGCMRCGKSGGVIFRPWGEFFRDEMRPDVRTKCARFHHETASRHRAANHAKRAASAACSCASIVEPRTPKRG